MCGWGYICHKCDCGNECSCGVAVCVCGCGCVGGGTYVTNVIVVMSVAVVCMWCNVRDRFVGCM